MNRDLFYNGLLNSSSSRKSETFNLIGIKVIVEKKHQP